MKGSLLSVTMNVYTSIPMITPILMEQGHRSWDMSINFLKLTKVQSVLIHLVLIV